MLNYAANLGPLNDAGNILGRWGSQDACIGSASPSSESPSKSSMVKMVPPTGPVQERPQDRSPRKRDRRTAGLMLNPGGSPDLPQGMRDTDFKGEIHPPPAKMSRLGMYETYQPWVLQTYGDSAKTKTITRNKYQRILQILRGDYVDNETSKFKLWVKGRGFRIGPPPGFVGGGGCGSMGGGGVEDALKDPLALTPLSSSPATNVIDYNPDKDPFPDIYVQTGTIKDQEGHDRICFKKVAVVEDFFDIIYNLHVCKDGKDQKHMGQKRTYRAVSERYAFVPREAVTKFLVLCTECPRRSVGVHVGVSVPMGVTTLPGAPSIVNPISNSMQVQPQSQTTPGRTADDRIGDKSRYFPLLQHQQTQSQPHQQQQQPQKQQNQQHVQKPPTMLKHQQQQTMPQPIHIHMKHQPKTKLVDIETISHQESKKQTQQMLLQQHQLQLQQQRQQQQQQHNEKQRQEQLNLQKQQEQREREEEFDKKVSAVSHDLEYRLPFTNIYLKHCHNNNNNNSYNNNNSSTTFNTSIAHDNDTLSDSKMINAGCDSKMMSGIHQGVNIDIINNNNIIKYNNNFTQTQGKDGPSLPESDGSEDELKSADVERKTETRGTEWCPYQPLGLTRTNETTRRSPCASPAGSERAATATPLDTASNAEDTSSNGNKDDEDDDADDDNDDDKIDAQYDPERLKAFNMFVRLFVDENLDRIVPISKQPKEKIQAIIDACARQFPEFAERTRKRIRTYLKSCRRNKRTRDSNGWETPSRPTPPHLTSIQAEQILANACENEAQNAKRMRLGLEPIAQPNPLNPQPQAQMASDKPLSLVDTVVKTESNAAPHVSALAKALERPLSDSKVMNGSSMFQASFQQSFQKVTSLTGSTVHSQPGLSPMLATTSAPIISNGPTDLSVKGSTKAARPSLNAVEVAAVRQLITGYRESAAFLLRSADELESLLIHQQSP